MRRLPTPLAALALSATLASSPLAGADAANPEAFQIDRTNTDALPKGKEADGILGDFVLRNGRIEALVSSNRTNRKANMGTNWEAVTPGCLYDLSVRGSANDQLTCLAPGNLEGEISSVQLLADGSKGLARVRATRTAAIGDRLEETHDYVLERGVPYLRITSTWTNRGAKKRDVSTTPVVKGLRAVQSAAGISYADAQNPRDNQGYAWTFASGSAGKVTLEPGSSVTVSCVIAPGHSPAHAFSRLGVVKGGTLVGTVRDAHDAGIPTADIEIPFSEEVTEEKDGKKTKRKVTRTLRAAPDAKGRFEVTLPVGAYEIRTRDIGRPPVTTKVEITADKSSTLTVTLADPGRVRFEVSELDSGREIPCKVQFFGIGDTATPSFGVPIQAHGCDHQYHSETGRFALNVPVGKYRVIVTRGIEYSHDEDVIRVEAGKESLVRASLRRIVDTQGWVSTDYHNHSTPSGDNYCGTDDRVINLAAEHIEFAPTTEHNRLYDWQPHIDKLGLAGELATVVGLELTGPNAHFNTFPLKVTPYAQDGGAPRWVHDPRINAIVLRDYQGGGAERWVQLNHPNVGRFFRDRNADDVADGGYPGLEHLIDAAEVWSTEILNLEPTYEYVNTRSERRRVTNRTFAWLQLLNQGRRMWCVSVSDAHSVFNNGVGGWRTYVPSSTDDVTKLDVKEIVRHSKAGRMIVSNGPFLEVELGDGTLPGGLTRASGPVELQIRVQTTTWIDIDRVQVLVNGRPAPALNFTRGAKSPHFKDNGALTFEGTVPVSLTTDAHLIVAAVGETSTLELGYGRSWQSSMRPCAFSNPIYVDHDGNGFRPNGDTLGHPLPLGK